MGDIEKKLDTIEFYLNSIGDLHIETYEGDIYLNKRDVEDLINLLKLFLLKM